LPAEYRIRLQEALRDVHIDPKLGLALIDRYDLDNIPLYAEPLNRLIVARMSDEDIIYTVDRSGSKSYLYFDEADRRGIKFDAQNWFDRHYQHLDGEDGLKTFMALINKGIRVSADQANDLATRERVQVYDWLVEHGMVQ